MLNLTQSIKYAFMMTNAGIAIAGAVWFIYANIDYKEVWYSESYIGGFMPTCALFYMLYGMIGFYGVYKNHEHALCASFGLALTSLVLRLINWILFKIHNIAMNNVLHYLFLLGETAIVGMSFFILRYRSS